MRNINVSTAVYAAIWAKRIEGEETEDEILTRVLGVTPSGSLAAQSHPGGGHGVIDGRSGVHFPEGFRIFRTYKGRDYAAVATGGQWLREDNNVLYPSLNQVNASIAASAENVWNGTWKFRDAKGAIRPIADLRSKIRFI